MFPAVRIQHHAGGARDQGAPIIQTGVGSSRPPPFYYDLIRTIYFYLLYFCHRIGRFCGPLAELARRPSELEGLVEKSSWHYLAVIHLRIVLYVMDHIVFCSCFPSVE